MKVASMNAKAMAAVVLLTTSLTTTTTEGFSFSSIPSSRTAASLSQRVRHKYRQHHSLPFGSGTTSTQRHAVALSVNPSNATQYYEESYNGDNQNSRSTTLQPEATPSTVVPPTTSVAPEKTTTTTSTTTTPLFEKFGCGIVRDFAARLPYTKSDITDGLNGQSLAATMFLFFACLAPAVGFGSLYHTATGGAMGTVEMIFSTAVCGLVYHLTAAQPLTIIGSTGPVLAFTACLAQLASTLSLPFLPLYAWTGLWTSGILMASSLTSASNLVKYLTRFTDEIFSTLISAIFVVEAFSKITGAFATTTLTKALLTLTTAMMTFTISSSLKAVRKTSFFTKSVRTAISNFAPSIGVIASCLTARWFKLKYGAAAAGLPALQIPAVFGTTTGRPWLVPIFDLPVWARWAAILPALMATVLLFLDQNITVRLVNNPKWKMTKGRRKGNVLDGMHADMLIISLLTAAQSLVGIPWLVAATVRSLSHVGALTQYNDEGEIVGTREQRVTGSAIHALIGCTIFFSKPRELLGMMPMPALTGLFLYLGISGLPGNEMWERFIGMFKDKSVAKPQRWTKAGVPDRFANRLTIIQIACLAGMFCIKESKVGVLFPLLIAGLAPIKFLISGRAIPEKYMDILDEE